jgi:hypothetical protein
MYPKVAGLESLRCSLFQLICVPASAEIEDAQSCIHTQERTQHRQASAQAIVLVVLLPPIEVGLVSFEEFRLTQEKCLCHLRLKGAEDEMGRVVQALRFSERERPLCSL